jgi:hypothetical protein
MPLTPKHILAMIAIILAVVSYWGVPTLPVAVICVGIAEIIP